MRITREIVAPHAPAGTLYPGAIDEEVARKLLGDDFDAALETGALEFLIEPLANKGWPTPEHAKTLPHIEPITRGARFMVRCRQCRFAADSAVETADEAIKSVSSAHDPSHTRYVAIPYPESA